MFGMGFAEILVVAVIAIIFLGPDKLPEAMVNVAKFFKKVKTTVNDAKDTIENELHIDEMKEEANKYKETIEKSQQDMIEKIENPSREVKDLFADLKEDVKIDTNLNSDKDKKEESK